MKPENLIRYQLIRNYLTLHSPQHVNHLAVLWEHMAIEIIALVGEGGFKSLYKRCIDLTKINFPLLEGMLYFSNGDQRYRKLQFSSQAPSSEQIVHANNQLLITFTDLLASLIGERIVDRIVQTAMDHSQATKSNTRGLMNE